jgi:MFS transporter, DHA1 family, tetracycline resistance protein
MSKPPPLVLILVTVLIDLLSATILVPVIPYLVRQYRDDALTIGALAAAYAALQFLSAPLLGALSDRFGRKPVIVVSLLGTALSLIVFGLAGSLPLLFIARMLDGLTGANTSTAQAYIADVSPPEQRARNFGLLGASFGVAFVLGPAIGGLLSQVSLQLPAFVAAGLALVNTALVALLLPESLPRERREQGPLTLARVNPLSAIAAGWRLPGIALLLAAFAALTIAFVGMTSNLGVLTAVRFRWSATDFAWLAVLIGVVSMIMAGGLNGPILKRLGERSTAVLGFGLQIAAYLGITFASEAWMLFPACVLLASGGALSGPAIDGLMSNRVGPAQQGLLFGVRQSTEALISIGAPLGAGLLFDAIAPGAPYLAGAVAIATALVLTLRAIPAAGPGAQQMAAAHSGK